MIISLRRQRLALAAIVTSACAVAAPALALTPAEVFAKASPSIWMVQARHDDTGVGDMGSAVVIGPRTLVTACHVVIGATSVSVTHGAGRSVATIVTVTRDPDLKRDLCLLTTAEDLGAPAVAIAPDANARVGDPVYAIGGPRGLELTLTDGLISSLRPVANEKLSTIQSSAPIAPGSSGGGLFDKEARLIGVTVSIAAPQSESLAFAVPAQWVVELPARVAQARLEWHARLKAAGVTLGPDGNAAPSGWAALTDTAKIPFNGPLPKGLQDSYRQFLLLAKPRAFVLTSEPGWGTYTDVSSLTAVFNSCEARKVKCSLYAVDDAVVWKP